MAHGLAAFMRKMDKILKNGLFTGNFNILGQVQPKRLELRGFVSESSVYLSNKPPKIFYKSTSRNEGSKSYLLNGGGDVQGGDKEKSNRTGSGGKTKRWISVAIGTTAGIVGMCWVYSYSKKDEESFNSPPNEEGPAIFYGAHSLDLVPTVLSVVGLLLSVGGIFATLNARRKILAVRVRRH